MKKLSYGMLVLALVLGLATTASAYTGTYSAGTGINATPHDIANPLTNYPRLPTADPLSRICIYCHAPHNTYKLAPPMGPGVGVGGGEQAPSAFDYLPLWNHELTANYAAYTMYQNGPGAPQTGPHSSQAISLGMTPGSTSLLCLSCHDGSVAVNSYGLTGWQIASSVNQTAGPTIGNSYVIGKDAYLGNHHPIGFDYEAAQLLDSELRVSSTSMTSAAAPYGSATTIKDHLYGAGNTLMECGTCHSVHNKGNGGETLLWRSDTQSRLCLTCHDKGTYTAP